MKRTRNKGSKIVGKGAITIDVELLKKLKGGELEGFVSLIQSVAQSALDEVSADGRTVLVSYGNPSVVEVDLKKLAKLEYDSIRQELLKLVDVQRKEQAVEADRLERKLGR